LARVSWDKGVLTMYDSTVYRVTEEDIEVKGIIDRIHEEITKNAFLFSELVKRDFKKKYKGTVLGILWSALSPLTHLLVMSIFRVIFMNRAHFLVYLFCGSLIFSYFSEATRGGMDSLRINANIFSKMNVKKYMFLFSSNVVGLIHFAITLAILFVFVAVDKIPFSPRFFLLLYPTLGLLLFNIGVGLILSVFYVFFRDLSYLYGIITMMLMFVSAIFYPIDLFPLEYQKYFLLNPVFVYIKYFRTIIIDAAIPNLTINALAFIYPVIVIAIGLGLYKKYDNRFLYYI
jgi:ABC-2 type transport system permease protein